MNAVRSYIAQRASAAIMAPLVVVHIATVLYAVRNGLDAAEILARTRGSWAWFGFYALFVACASVHASLGMASVLREWAGMTEKTARLSGFGLGVITMLLGLRAIAAVVL